MKEFKQENISAQETPREQKAGVYFEDGQCFLVLDEKSKLELPREIGVLVQELLALEDAINQDDENADAVVARLHESFNCHKVVLYILGLLNKEGLVTKKEREKRYAIQVLPNIDYKEYVEYEKLMSAVKEELGGSIGVMQQGYVSEYGNGLIIVHSFLCGVDNTGEVICFEKMNKGSGAPFQVISLDKLYKKDLLCGIVKLENIDKDELGGVVQGYVELENSSVKEELVMEEKYLDAMHKEKDGYPIDGTLKEKNLFGLKWFSG